MTEQRRTSLKQLQKLDMRIQAARQRIQDFEPLLEEVEKPALVLGGELETSRTRLQEMRLEERRLELSVDERRTREKRLDERLGSVRNLREEAAVSAELEMVRRALQNDEQEALTLLDQIRKMEDRLGELEAAFTEAREIVQPKKEELLAERAEAEKQLESLLGERQTFVQDMPRDELRIYEAIRGGRRGVAVAELTPDGACGHCFGMVPLQVQNEVRHGTALLRCESCGVILAAPEPPGSSDETPGPGQGASASGAPPADAPAEAEEDASEDASGEGAVPEEASVVSGSSGGEDAERPGLE